MNIDGKTLILIFWFLRVSAGPQKPQTLTSFFVLKKYFLVIYSFIHIFNVLGDFRDPQQPWTLRYMQYGKISTENVLFVKGGILL